VAILRGRRVRDADLGRLVHHRRLMKPIGSIPPAEAEERYDAMPDDPTIAA